MKKRFVYAGVFLLAVLLLALLTAGASADMTPAEAFWNSLTRTETSVVIPDCCTYIPGAAFANNRNLQSVTIPDSVTQIGESAFEDCTALQSVVIPASVTSIGYAAFSNCSSLTEVTILGSGTALGMRAFYGCGNISEISIPDMDCWYSYDHESTYFRLRQNGGTLYANGAEVTAVDIPYGTQFVKKYLFMGCSGITSVSIPDTVISIGYRAFAGCSSLT